MRSVVVAAWAAGVLSSLAAGAENWPAWRGPRATGSSSETGLPATWSESHNVVWKLPVPGVSGSTPIVWEGFVFVNVAQDDELFLWAVDAAAGERLWQRLLHDRNRQERKQDMSSPSPVTDGEHVWALTGTGVLKSFDFAGNERWRFDLQGRFGRFGMYRGYASSPLLHGGAVIVQVVHGKETDRPSYLVSFDADTGALQWRVERPTDARGGALDAYTSPALLRTGGGPRIVVSGADYVTGHDPATGAERFRWAGLNPRGRADWRIVASPLVVGELVVVPSNESPLIVYHGRSADEGAAAEVAWRVEWGPDVPTPASDGRHLFVLRDHGVVSAYEVATGAPLWTDRRVARGTYSASPVVADGKLYLTSEDGVTTVIAAGPEFRVLAENELEGYTLSSMAVSGGRLYYRNARYLYAIGDG